MTRARRKSFGPRSSPDLETPVSAFLKVASGTSPAFLLESVEGGAVRGRYSIIGLRPDLVFRVVGGRAEINRSALASPLAFQPCSQPPLQMLRELIAECRIELPHELPPPSAGLFGYLGYDMVRQMEKLAEPNMIRSTRRMRCLFGRPSLSCSIP